MNLALSELLQMKEAELAQVADEIVASPQDHRNDVQAGHTHTQIQYSLAALGRALGYEVWIPKSDQGKEHNSATLGQFSMEQLPALPYSAKVIRIIQNIDVIWFSDEHPTHLFEVEHTTSIYSGLLRMSDFAALIPSIQIQMFICADENRKKQVFAEATRPTFDKQKPPLRSRCRFISYDTLIDFLNYQADYMRFINVAILDELSETIPLPQD